jgi:hypothetical protein
VKAIAVEKLHATGYTYAQAIKEVELSAQRQAPGPVVPRSNASYSSIVADSSPLCPSPVALTTVAISVDVHQSQGSCSGVHTKQSRPLVGQQAQSGSTVVAAEGRGSESAFADLRGIMKEELASGEKRLDDSIHASLTGFSIKLGQFMKVFKLNLLSEGTKERSLLLISLLRNAFGQEVSDTLQREWLPANKDASGHDQVLSVCPEVRVSTLQPKNTAGQASVKNLTSPPGQSFSQLTRVVTKPSGRAKARGKGKIASSSAQ